MPSFFRFVKILIEFDMLMRGMRIAYPCFLGYSTKCFDYCIVLQINHLSNLQRYTNPNSKSFDRLVYGCRIWPRFREFVLPDFFTFDLSQKRMRGYGKHCIKYQHPSQADTNHCLGCSYSCWTSIFTSSPGPIKSRAQDSTFQG